MKRWLFIVVCAFLLTGCQMQKEEEISVGRPVISSIEVMGEYGVKIYTNEEKMQQILHKLRRLGQKFTPEVDPETLEGNAVSIVLNNSNGDRELYQTKADRFVRHGRQPWQQADAKRIRELNALLESLPADG